MADVDIVTKMSYPGLGVEFTFDKKQNKMLFFLRDSTHISKHCFELIVYFIPYEYTPKL